ncbi:MarR family transcriptional regulator [Streptomycetaceae bacterium NBC_01309]
MSMPADQRLGLDVKRAEQTLLAAKSAAVRAAGLTVPQYAALLLLSDNPGMSAAALARGCMVTPQAMTALLKTLDERGLVTRTPHPWHRAILETRLTPDGTKALRAADKRAVAIEQRITDAFTPEERETLRSLLTRFRAAVERDEEP